MYKIPFLILILSFLLIQCTNDKQNNEKLSTFKIRISKEPSALLPFKRRGRAELQINPYIFLQIADFDPINHKLIPTLIESIPDEIKLDTGIHKGLLKHTLTLRKDAKWDNGTSISANDYLFSVKILLNPMLEIHPAIRNQFKNIRDIVIYKDDPRKIDVYTVSDYMLTKELVTNMEIYPEYFYDSLHLMREYNYKIFLNTPKILSQLQKVPAAKEFAKNINGTYFMRDNVSNIGPYYLDKWETNQYISLKRKKKWWGTKYKNNSFLKNNPDKILFKIIPDNTTALTELKNGNIDLLNNIPGIDFNRLKNDNSFNKMFDFYSPLSLRYSVIILNNRNIILSELKVRQALAHITDVDFLIKNFGTGKEKRLIGPIHISKTYYNKKLQPIKYDTQKAKKLLAEAGWSDSNHNGILDKIINGKLTELSLNFTIVGRQIEKNTALLLKENAKNIGINISIVTKNKKNYQRDRKNLKFDMIISNIGKDLVDYDPYPRWHSDNIDPGMTNLSGFHTDKCDSIIEKIQQEKNRTTKDSLYKKFQKIIYENQPVIFLYVPTNNIIVNNKYKITTSIKRPGYFANTAKSQ